jgi:hypothetical protein
MQRSDNRHTGASEITNIHGTDLAPTGQFHTAIINEVLYLVRTLETMPSLLFIFSLSGLRCLIEQQHFFGPFTSLAS